MCSKTSSGSYGDQLQDDYAGSCPKKHKKDKIRRRGPGVAELEKIRLEEENHKSPLSSSSSLPNIDHTFFPPLPENSIYNTNPIFRPPATCDLVMMSPNFALPEKLPSQVFPFLNGSFPKNLIPPVPDFQRKKHSLHHQTMNLSRNPSIGAGGLYQFIEPPSNQRSCIDNVSHFPDEEKKVVSVKRPWHFLKDTSTNNITKASVGPTITNSRDVKQNRPVDTRFISPIQDSGTKISNPIPTFIPRDYPRFMPLSLQYEQQQQKAFDDNMQWIKRKPFYSFIPSDDHSNGDREQRAPDRYESTTDHGIDLSLKL